MGDEMYLENLEEYIYDESRLVTYKWLSFSLNVHVNQAKQMLYSFVQHERNVKDRDDLSVCYLVAGVGKDGNGNKGLKISVVKEENLDIIKSSLDIVTSCHVYSVQKSKLKESGVLYAADRDIIRDHILSSNQHSAIKHEGAVLRSSNEINLLREQRSSKGYEAGAGHKPSNVSNSAPLPSKGSESKSGSTNSGSGSGSNKGGITGMFAAASSRKSSEESKKEACKSKTSKNDQTAKPKQGAMMAFVSKQTEKPKIDTACDTKNNVNSATLTEKPMIKKMSVSDDEEPLPKKSSASKKKKADSEDEDALPQKSNKRRKLQTAWESSSEEEEEMEDEELIPPTPPPAQRKKSPSPKKCQKPEANSPSPCKKSPSKEKVEEKPKENTTPPSNKNSSTHTMHKKKLVSKTYVNEDGYMVTEKVWEDQEIEIIDEPKQPTPKKAAPNETTKATKKEPAKKNTIKSNAKQTSMMSFFKKK